MRRFGNLNLGVKLNILLLLVLSILFVGVVILLNRNTDNLTKEVGGERIAEEANIMERRLAEVEEDLMADINFLVPSISFYQAVGSRNETQTSDIITTANSSMKMDDITVVDGDGKRLVDTQADEDTAEEDKLLAVALTGKATTTLLIEENSNDIQISIAAAAPVVNPRTGNILGAIQIGRHVNDVFLEQLTFGRDRVHLGLIYEGQILARTTTGTNGKQTSYANSVLSNGVAFDNRLIQTAQNGQTIIYKDLIQGDGGIPHTAAYTPVLSNADSSAAVIMILVDLEEISTFQRTTLTNTIMIFAALTLIAVAIIYVTITTTTIRPLNKLKAISQTMTSGQYDERMPVSTRDEVGQLAAAFNEMANAIQQRESSLKVAREQAERADKVKSMFLASMSHELRTPLNAIINLTKFVGKGMYGPVNPEQIDVLGKAEASGKHLLNLINDVLDISKIEAGSLELFVESGVKIDEIARTAVETGRGILGEKPVTILLEIEPGLPPLLGDEQRILQIVLNLISNACKFTEQGQILVKVYQRNGEIQISICDSGPGIDPNEQEAIFEVFRQAKAGLRKGGGTGLGLPISRRLAEAHGGRLWVDSARGKGATFYVALPIESTLEPTV
jgi:signal transduction histidine kinase